MSRRTSAVLATLAATVLATGLSACSGSGGADETVEAGCAPGGDGTTYRALVDDKGALPAGNWVPVVEASGRYRALLESLDAATRGLSGGDLVAIAAASDRDAAAEAAVADVTAVDSDADGPRLTLAVPTGAAGEAVGAYYDAALRRAGAAPTVRVLEPDAAVVAIGAGEVDAAVLELTSLGEALDTEVAAGDASEQVQAVAAAAFEDGLALGATAAASSTPQVLVSDAVEPAAGAVTLSDLAAACDGATIAVRDAAEQEAAAAAEAVAATYGFELGEDGADAVAVVAAP